MLYAWKAFLDAGVPLLRSGLPVNPINTPSRHLLPEYSHQEAGTRTYFPQDNLTIGHVCFA